MTPMPKFSPEERLTVYARKLGLPGRVARRPRVWPRRPVYVWMRPRLDGSYYEAAELGGSVDKAKESLVVRALERS